MKEKYVPTFRDIELETMGRMTDEQKQMTAQNEGAYNAGFREARTFDNLREMLRAKIGKTLVINVRMGPHLVGELLDPYDSNPDDSDKITLKNMKAKVNEPWERDGDEKVEVKYSDIISIRDLSKDNFEEQLIWKRPA